MKKSLSYLVLLAVAAMTISSCDQAEVDTPENLSKDGYRYEFVINDENAVDGITKAALSHTGVEWQANDRVGMFLEGYTGYANINMENDPRTVVLYSTAVIPANSFAYAYYPYSTDNDDKTAAKIVLPHVQSGASQSAMPLAGVPFKVETEAAAASRPDGIINFMNLGSIIDFKVYSADYDDEVVDYITFTATNTGAVVAGDGYLDLTAVDQNDESTLELMFGLGDDYDYVKVNNANTAVASTKDAASSIYMVLNPGTYSGTITIGTDKATYTFNFTDKTLVRNQLKHYNMNLSNATTRVAGVVETVVNLPYSEPFDTGAGEFVVEDISNGDNFTIWSHSTQNGTYMKATGYENNNSRHAAESRLVSPWIDLTGVSHAYAQFDHAHRYAGTASTELTFWVLTDETNATWQQETIPTYAAGNNWTFVNSGEIDLSAYAGNKVKIAFKYISDGTSSGTSTWEINNVYVAEKVYTTEFTMANEITVEVGKTKNNNVTVNSGADITYSSDDESIATVAADGTITGVAEGDTYINVHVDANGGYPAKDDLFEVHVIPAKAAPDPETIDFSSLSLENGVAYNDPFDGGNFTVTFASGGNNGKYYTTGTAIRVYGGGSFTVASADYTIVKIELTYGSGDGSNTITTNVPTFSNSTWTGSASSVTFTVGDTTGHRRIKKIKVTYDGGGSTPTPTTYNVTISDGITNGTVQASKSTGIEAGETINLTATPATGYIFSAWDVYKTGDSNTKVTVTNNSFTMPAYDVTVSATFDSYAPQGNSVTFDFSSLTETVTGGWNGDHTVSPITITATAANTNKSGQVRFQNNGTVTFSGATITRIEIINSGNYPGDFSANVGNYSISGNNGIWTGSASTVVLTNNGNGTHTTSIVVTYE